MSVEVIIRNMKGRMPWSVAQKVLAECEIHRSMGWDRTLDQITDTKIDYSQQTAALTEALREHILCGEKASTFFSLSEDTADRLRSVVKNLTVEKNAFEKAYPFVLDDEELSKQRLGAQLAAIEVLEHGVGLVFCSPRVLTSRETLNANDFPDDAPQLFSKFDEIVGLKIKRFHAFDVVWIPNDSNLIDIRIDFPNGAQLDQTLAALKNTIDCFNKLIGEDVLSQEINLFPLIERMYFAPKEGHVVELGFGTSTASLKHEKMRRKGLCLRQETYHKGGSDALKTKIEPHRISIVWRRAIDDKTFSTPELSLNSNSRAAGSENPVLSSAVITKCMGFEDYSFVRDRIEHYLHTGQHNN
ncbi:hypothetical protein ACFSE0_07545 [Ochrobactrum teleogrylli]|uniref:Uncharacterized protein n=1 Tax=Ochrobactrum teleogrylli TaxID=2479765 RepID=A0ABY2Y1T0_9HYPH|nr:hypothetical protein [[Ochrobactrum] teleogrylli]TNV13242.1 hypothetical protein FIC94_16030 [[Ochrobactrum] teleogrylli]